MFFAHDKITLYKILPDCLVLGFRDEKVRERILRGNDLTLSKAILRHLQSCRTDQSAIKVDCQLNRWVSWCLKNRTEEWADSNTRRQRDSPNNGPECRYCGYHHANRQCPARGQTCHKCGRKNHFQSKCRSTFLSFKWNVCFNYYESRYGKQSE